MQNTLKLRIRKDGRDDYPVGQLRISEDNQVANLKDISPSNTNPSLVHDR